MKPAILPNGLTPAQSHAADVATLRLMGVPTSDVRFDAEQAFEDFQTKVRHACLDALDQVMEDMGMSSRGMLDRAGWKDQDLPILFSGLDRHATVLWVRHGAQLALAAHAKAHPPTL